MKGIRPKNDVTFMSLEDIQAKVKIAQEAVKNLDPGLKEKAFELILNRLLGEGISKAPAKVSVPSERKPPAKPRGTAPSSIAPIPLDLKGGGNAPSLRDFYEQKSPKSNQEKITVFTYYVSKLLQIRDVLPSHILSCYNEVGVRKSLNVVQMFKNIKHRRGWLETGELANSVRISVAGENFVEHDLPKIKK